MTHIHYKNDFTLDISLSSDALGTALDPKAVHSITFYTRKNGRTYKVCYGANTLIAGDNIVTAVFDQPINLEPGVLKYVVEYELHDDKFPDFHKKINQHFVSDIELVQGNGETEIADLQAMFGETIDSKLDSIDSSIAELSNTENLLSAAIVGIREIDAVQNSSINMIEDILTGIHGGEAEQIAKLNSSVNKLEGDVSTLNSSVSGIENDITRMGDVISGLGEDIAEVSAGLAGKADAAALNSYYTKNESDTRFQPKGNYLTEHQSLVDYPTNASIVANYAKKTELPDMNAYVTKDYADQVYVNSIGLETSQDEQNDYIAQTYLSQTDANLNYVSYENIDEIIINTVDNNYTFQNKVIDVINTSTAVKDIPVLSTNIQNVSTKLTSDYLTAQTVNADFVKNASLNTELTKYVLKSTAEETYLTSDDISTFKPIVFCTQEEYDALVENDQVDANTVYMLSGDQTGDDYLTPDDVSNFVTNDDVSIYLTKQEGQGLINQAYRDVNQMMGTDLGQITAQGGTVQNYLETNYTSKNDASIYLTEADMSNYVTDSSLSENYLRYYQATFKPGNTSFNLKNIKNFDILNSSTVFSIGNWGIHRGLTLGQKFKGKGTVWSENSGGSVITNMYNGEVYSGILLGTKTWTGREFTESDTRLYTKVDSYNKNDLTVTFDLSTYLMTNNDVSTYVSANFASKDDISTFITSNDASVYVTTSYVDTQIGNIQNILATI